MVKDEPEDETKTGNKLNNSDPDFDILSVLKNEDENDDSEDRHKRVNNIQKESSELKQRRSYTIKQKIDALG